MGTDFGDRRAASQTDEPALEATDNLVHGSVSAAERAAAKEAEAAGVTPQAVMHSSPAGYGSGAKDSLNPDGGVGTDSPKRAR